MKTEIQNKFNLEERTAVFGEKVIGLCKKIENEDVNRVLVRQLVRSATSIGANYMEANGADSKKDFHHKISLCKKESKETMHWLRMLVTASPSLKDDLGVLWQEAKELSLIFGSINRKMNENGS